MIENPLSQKKPASLLGVISHIFLVLSPMALSSVVPPVDSMTVVWDANLEQDVVGYRLHLGTASGQYSRIIDVVDETLHELADLDPLTTYYCAIRAYNDAGLESEYSEEFEFTTNRTGLVELAGEIYDDWIQSESPGLDVEDHHQSAVPFSDGVPNLLKYAFNLNPDGPDVTSLGSGSGTKGLPVFSLGSQGERTLFTVEYLRRRSSGLKYTPMTSSSLDRADFSPMAGIAEVTPIDSDWERVRVVEEIDPSVRPRHFGRVEVIMP